MSESIVLLSAGLDSLVNFQLAYLEGGPRLVLTFDYGQASAAREIEAAKAICEEYQIAHHAIRLDWMKDMRFGLRGDSIPEYDPARLNDHEYALETAEAVWVPNRNGVMINIAASYADERGLARIVVGFNREEGETFPDNTPEYLQAVSESLSYSTRNGVEVFSYTGDMNKTEIVELGIEKDAPFHRLWSCYRDGERMCGRCESCRRLIRAMENAGFTQRFRKINPRAPR